MLDKIKKRLGANYTANDDNVLNDMIDDYSNIAKKTSNRNSVIGLEPYIKNAVISSYLRLGAEGQKNRNEGSLSSTFIDIEEKMRQDIIKDGMRLLR